MNVLNMINRSVIGWRAIGVLTRTKSQKITWTQLALIWTTTKVSSSSSKSYSSNKIESYFSAIGGDSDKPPPDLTPSQVSTILRTNETAVTLSEKNSLSKIVKEINANQLAANHPIEDRLKVSQVRGSKYLPDTLFLGVFDGHGGSFCSDVISKRLFNYLAISLSDDPIAFVNNAIKKEKENQDKEFDHPPINEDEEDELISYAKLFRVVDNLIILPKFDQHKNIYDIKSLKKIRKLINLNEKTHLIKYANKIQESRLRSKDNNLSKAGNNQDKETNNQDNNLSMTDKIIDAFLTCDADISREIQTSLRLISESANVPRKVPPSGNNNNFELSKADQNLLQHFYLSLAVSGACANVAIIQDNFIYVANTGDCRAVLGFVESDNQSSKSDKTKSSPNLKCVNLSTDHNSDNISEIKRLFDDHPIRERNNIIKYNRLLGQLMPLRAFGDFGYKWKLDEIRATGLTRAFGPHVIPPNYETPPYLTAEPEITITDLSKINNSPDNNILSVIIATDGLWESYESSRDVIQEIFDHDKLLSQINSHSNMTSPGGKNSNSSPSDQNVQVTYNFKEGTKLKDIHEILTRHGAPEIISYDEKVKIGSDEDIIDESSFDDNTATHVLRSCLGQLPPSMIGNVADSLDIWEQKRQEHKRLVSFLTLPESVVRNFRDDISIIVINLCN